MTEASTEQEAASVPLEEGYRDWFDAWWEADYSWDGKNKHWIQALFLKDVNDKDLGLFDVTYNGVSRQFTWLHLPIVVPILPFEFGATRDFGLPTYKHPKVRGPVDDELIIYLNTRAKELLLGAQHPEAHLTRVVRSDIDLRARLDGVVLPNTLDVFSPIEATPYSDNVSENNSNQQDQNFREPTLEPKNQTSISAKNAFFGGGIRAAHCELVGETVFTKAWFSETVDFEKCRFHGRAIFWGARFCRNASFQDALFGDGGTFRDVNFLETANFHRAEVQGGAIFAGTQVFGDGIFERTKFDRHTSFESAGFHQQVSFNEAEFLGHTIFTNAHFHGLCTFDASRFQGRAIFWGGCFGVKESGPTSFIGVKFSEDAEFGAASFFGDTSFQYTEFCAEGNGRAIFGGACFLGKAEFEGAKFQGKANFECAKFENVGERCAFFRGASFFKAINFRMSSFAGLAQFQGAQFHRRADFARAEFGTGSSGLADFSSPEPYQAAAPGLASFSNVSFEQVTFHGDVSFNNRTFLGETSFFRTRFLGIPAFHGAVLYQGTEFQPLELPAVDVTLSANGRLMAKRSWTKGISVFAPALSSGALAETRATGEEVEVLAEEEERRNANLERAFRTLKQAMGVIKSRQQESEFFMRELDARRAQKTSTTSMERFLLTSYQTLSDYGYSLSKPLIWAIKLTAVFSILYLLPGLPASFSKTAMVQMGSISIEQSVRPFIAWTPYYRNEIVIRHCPSQEQGAPNICSLEQPDHWLGYAAQNVTWRWTAFRIMSLIQSVLILALLGFFFLAVRRRFQMN